MNGLVEMYGCDAIACPRGKWSDAGRQEDDDSACQNCQGGTGGAMGATECATKAPRTDELPILAEFYLAVSGDQWTEQTGWDSFAKMESPADLTLASYQQMNIDPCTFHGIECGGEGRVTHVKLPNNGLEGLVPSSFWDMISLAVIDLSGNEVRLDRDFGFGDMGNAPSLRKVDLSSNDIQTFKGLGAASKLEELVVDDAYFFGSLDEEVYGLESLKTLHMQFSGLKNAIPAGLSRLKNLKALK